MATTPVIPPAEPSPSISPFARVLGALVSPKATFQDIVRRPTWITPAAIITVLSILVCVAINQRTNWREFIGRQMEQNPSTAQLSAEQKEQRIEAGEKVAPLFTYIFGIPAAVVVMLVVALVMMGAYNLLGGASVNFKTSLGIVSHAFVPSIVSSLVFLIVLYLRDPGTVDLENPIAANVAAFLPEGLAKWVLALGKSLDIFTIWTLMLIAVGFAAASPKKLKGSKAFSIAFSVWLVFLIVRVGWAFIFS
jgi:Yip1 domain